MPRWGDYFASGIDEVTHGEDSLPELMLAKLLPADGELAAFNERKLDEHVESYAGEG